jgi:protein dithiol:quinone oxidoreductase
MARRSRLRNRPVLLLMAVVCTAAVTTALVSQHRFDMQPCPWCILQRLIFIMIALAGFAGAGLQALTRPAAALIALLSTAGAAAAVYQNRVAAFLPSCDLTLADRIISGLGIDAWLPEVFEVRASCADAAVKVFGVPFELWALLLYGVLGFGSVLLLLRRGKRT